jgi:hypothetical protein
MQDDYKDADALQEIRRLEEEKNPLKAELKEVAELCIPESMDMDGNLSEQILNSPGHYSGLAKVNLQVFAQGTFAHMIGGDVDWLEAGEFGNKVIMESRIAQEYYEEIRTLLIQGLYDDGYMDVALPAFKNAGGLGTDVVTVTPNIDSKRADFIHWHPGDVFIGHDAGGRVDRCALKLRTTVHDLAEKKFNISKEMKRIATESPKKAERKIEIWYYYRRIRQLGKYLDTGMRWELLVIDKAGVVIHESPMRSLPGAIWRFFRKDRSSYGMGMGTMLRRDMMQSNKIQKLLMMEGEQRVNPAMWMPAGVDAYLEPDSITYQTDMTNQQMFPRRMIEVAEMTGIAALKAEIDRLCNIIFYTDFFMQLAGNTTRKTAQEISGLWQETSAQITAVVDTVERNHMMPIVRRYLMVMMDQNRLPPVPNIIKANTKGSLGIRFIGPLAKARRYTYTIAQDQRMISEIIAPMAQVDPGILDYIDKEAYLKRAAQYLGGGRATILSQAEVDGIRAERAMREMMMEKMKTAQAAVGNSTAAEPGSPAEAALSA